MSALVDILLVEDDPGHIRLAQETLKDYRLQNSLHVVTDGEEALKYLLRQPPYERQRLPDLLLLDLNLPKIDGIEVIEEMQRHPELAELPVVILTSTSVDRDVLQKYNIPVDCFIPKPLTVERYLDAVRCFPQFGLGIVHVERNRPGASIR